MSPPPEHIMTRQAVAALIAMAVVLGLAWSAYQPGLAGGFLFDDWVNLDALGAFGPIDNATTLWRYLTSGNADFTGRPLALASFLLDARDWPADPYSFKRTNLILHLTNGVLLAELLRQLGRALYLSPVAAAFDGAGSATDEALRIDLAAVLGSALWLLHPLLVSTTLYVVQREAMLPATFILIGLIGYIAGRKRAAAGQRRGVWLAAAFITGCTVFATLCKANGALLPLLAWLLDALLLAPRLPVTRVRTATAFRRMRRLILMPPSLLLLAALLVVAVQGFTNGISVRPWSLGERLLTQARVMVDYLDLLWLPRPYSHGLFNDGFLVSHGLLSPATTLSCIALLTLLAGAAFTLRRRQPMLAAAILFFFAAHLMESGVVPLEMYFEHRNYVPAMLMFWPLAWWLAGAWAPRVHDGLVWTRRGLCFALPLLLAALTLMRADLWGNVADQATLWAQRNPYSARAQAYAAQTQTERGWPERAIERLVPALALRPHQLQLAANLVDAHCALGDLTAEHVDTLVVAFERDRQVGGLAFVWLSSKLDALTLKEAQCRGLELLSIERLIGALASNPTMAVAPGRLADVSYLRGRALLLHGDAEGALTSFDAGLNILPTPAKALRQAAILADAGRPDLGLRHLDRCTPTCGEPPSWNAGMPALHARLLESQGYWENEITQLRGALGNTQDN